MTRRTGIATGERIDRWVATGSAADVGGVMRVRVADETGRPAEALVLGPEVSAEVRERFARRHRGLQALEAPGLLRTLDVVVGADRVVVVREPTEEQGLGQIEGPLSSDVVAAVGAHLAVAARTAGGCTDGALFPEDIALDASGRPVLAPVGLDRATVPRQALGHVAPEAFKGAAPDGDAALYGLGSVLYLLLTGQPPQASTQGAPPPPPASTRRHGVPPELDRALQQLLSHDPAARAAALPLLQAVAGPIPDLRPTTRSRRVGEVVYTTRATVEAAGRPTAPGATVVVTPARWRSLDPQRASRLAGEAGLALTAAEALVRDDLPVVVSTHAGLGAARRAAEALAREGLPAQAMGTGGVPGSIPMILGLLVALPLAALGLLGSLVGYLLFVGLPLLGLSAMVALTAVAAGRWIGRGRREAAVAEQALERIDRHRRTRSPGGRLDAAWGRVARLRVQLAEQEHLPAPAEADLRDALRDVEERLQAIADGAEAASASLKQVDAAGLRTRLAALERRSDLDAERRAERDRLARTVTDLDAVEAQRQRILGEVQAVDVQLDRLAAAVGRAGVDGDLGLQELARAIDDDRRRAAAAARRQPQ